MVRTWHVADWRPGRQWSAGGRIMGLAFSPDGRLLAAAIGIGAVRVWQADSGKEVHDVRGHAGVVEGLAFTPDGKTLVTAGDDGMVPRGHVATGRPLLTLHDRRLGAAALAVTPDGNTIVAGGASGGVRPSRSPSWSRITELRAVGPRRP